MNTPQTRIDLMERSLRCFTTGWCSLLPLTGPFLLVVAIRHFLHVRRNSENHWNPARHYLTAGLFLATVGCIETLLILAAVIMAIVLQNPFADSN